MSEPSSTARTARTNGWSPGAGRPRAKHRSVRERPIGTWGFAGVAIAALGGPLALAALIVPAVTEDAISSAGLVTIAATVVFVAPLAIWLLYVRHLRTGDDPTRPGAGGGLYTFVLEAAGPRVALVQAAVWTLSYLLYIIYTTIQIVYDLLPLVLPGEVRYQTVLALAIPVAVAATMIAGRAAALVVIGAVAISQLVLGGILDGVTVAHLSFPLSSFGTSASGGSFAKAGAMTSLLYICAGLPLFLGGELAAPARTTRRGLIGAYLVTAVIVVLAVAPLAGAPGLARTDIPGVELAAEFSGTGLARAIGIGVAVSIAGVILCEYLALTRLLAAIGGWATRRVSVAVGVIVVAAAPITLIDPEGIYNVLAKVSVAALWISQLIVFAVFPRFAARRGLRPGLAWALTAIAGALAVYGLYTTFVHSGS
jgi:amino acid transporter